MTNNVKLKEAFEVESKHGAFYTGGNIEQHSNHLYCQTSNSISVFNLDDGTVSLKIGKIDECNEDSDSIQTFTSNGEQTVTSHKSGLLKLWNSEGELVKLWKYIHKGPIASLKLNKNQLLASGGADGNIRLWDLNHQTCFLNLKGCQGVVNVVEFRNDDHIYGSGDDGKIISWDITRNQRDGKTLIYSGHYSKVTSLVFCNEGNKFASCGRDKVIILWEFNQLQPLKILPVYETLESICDLPTKFKLPGFKSDSDCFYVASGGNLGFIRIWDLTNSKEIYKQTNSLVNKQEDGGLAITKLLCDRENKTVATVSSDHNVIIHNLKSFIILKQLIGFTDEILDLVLLGQKDEFLAIATNSSDIKVYENKSMNCQLLKGHTDIVLCLNSSKTNPNLLLSSSKDNTVRLWTIEGAEINCLGVGRRHTASVGSISCCNTSNSNYFVSISQDGCLKLWDLPEESAATKNLECKFTESAHNKDINCVAVSPNDKIIATASQDKTAKLWTDSLSFVGTLKGHKRGVWSVTFSPSDQIVMTSSADCTIKLWSVSDLSCLKTLAGHESSVLKAEFLSNGLQIVSTGGDGLIKLFNIKSSECQATYDEHLGRVWALVVKKDESGFLTAGSDSVLIKWKDVSDEKRLERVKKDEEVALEEQKLSNYLQNDQLLKALKLALKLDRPLQTLRIIQRIIRKKDETSLLADTIRDLRNDQKELLLKCACDWNTYSRNCAQAQLVLNILLNELQTGDFRPVGLNSSLEGALAYTERHFKRLTQLLQDLNLINYTVNCMNPSTV